jgi:hypothetical protein
LNVVFELIKVCDEFPYPEATTSVVLRGWWWGGGVGGVKILKSFNLGLTMDYPLLYSCTVLCSCVFEK